MLRCSKTTELDGLLSGSMMTSSFESGVLEQGHIKKLTVWATIGVRIQLATHYQVDNQQGCTRRQHFQLEGKKSIKQRNICNFFLLMRFNFWHFKNLTSKTFGLNSSCWVNMYYNICWIRPHFAEQCLLWIAKFKKFGHLLEPHHQNY